MGDSLLFEEAKAEGFLYYLLAGIRRIKTLKPLQIALNAVYIERFLQIILHIDSDKQVIGVLKMDHGPKARIQLDQKSHFTTIRPPKCFSDQ
jgi:hypothetical protein